MAAQIPDIERQILAKENQISLLLGHNPGPIARGASLEEQNDTNDVPAGLPSTLLERRPDVRQAEEELIAANAEIGVQRANYFPTIGLSGAFGGASITLEQLVASGVIWSLGGIANGPIYTGGRLKAQVRQAYAARDQAELTWQQTLTSAFGEVSTYLNAHQKYAASLTEETRSVNAYRESVRLSTIRYDSGFASYFEISRRTVTALSCGNHKGRIGTCEEDFAGQYIPLARRGMEAGRCGLGQPAGRNRSAIDSDRAGITKCDCRTCDQAVTRLSLIYRRC